MRTIYILLFAIIFADNSTGQTTYRKELVNEYTKDTYEFLIQKDSTCFYKEYYSGNSTFILYSGHLRKIKDTLYEMKYHPVVQFTPGERDNLKSDSIFFYLDESDTIISSLKINVKVGTGNYVPVELKPNVSKLYLVGASHLEVLIDTKFTDPSTGNNVVMSVDKRSEPELAYYGQKAPAGTLKVSIKGNRLMLHPDNKNIHEKVVLLLAK